MKPVVVDGYESYLIYPSGNVYSKNKGAFLKQGTTKNGYRVVCLFKNGKGHTFYVHKLVANHFIENKAGLHEINHKNGCKYDNRKSNLEWCTRSQNLRHKVYNLGKPGGFLLPKKVKCIETGKTYDSIADAAKDTGSHQSNISKVIRGEIRKTNGLSWVALE